MLEGIIQPIKASKVLNQMTPDVISGRFLCTEMAIFSPRKAQNLTPFQFER